MIKEVPIDSRLLDEIYKKNNELIREKLKYILKLEEERKKIEEEYSKYLRGIQ
jgi:hypothetical protein